MSSSNKEADKARLSKVLNYIKTNTDEYSIVDYCQSIGLLKDAKSNAENYFISCPFHEDYSPSMLIHKDGSKFHCFSCGRKGDYLDFVKSYSELNGKKYTLISLCEKLLHDDIKMRTTLEFSSLFRFTNRNLTLDEVKVNKKPKLEKYEKINYLNLANKIIDKQLSAEDRIFAISMIQAGLPPNEIYANLFDRNASDVIDLNNIDDELDVDLS